MIKNWRLGNFKSVFELKELEFGELTILAGANSSGKSTILQSILLISQTLANHNEDKVLVLNGPIIQLGVFEDICSKNNLYDSIHIGFNISDFYSDSEWTIPNRNPKLGESIKQVDLEVRFYEDKQPDNQEFIDKNPRFLNCAIDWTVWEISDYAHERVEVENSLIIWESESRFEKYEKFKNNNLSENRKKALDYDVVSYEFNVKHLYDSFRILKDIIGVHCKHFLPYDLLFNYDEEERNAQKVAIAICEPKNFNHFFYPGENFDIFYMYEIPDNVIVYLKDLLKDLIDEGLLNELELSKRISSWNDYLYRLSDEKRYDIEKKLNLEVQNEIVKLIIEGKPNIKKVMFPYLEYNLIENVSDYIKAYFTSLVKYLGPLREEPSYLYPVTPINDPYNVGNKGQYTAAVFHEFKNKQIFYIPTNQLQEPKINTDFQIATLEVAVNDWLQYLDIATEIQTKDLNKYGIQITIKPIGSDYPIELKHMGVGVSQILPIVVMCLASDFDSTILIEQPELHLHPKIQSRLGDFFLATALSGRQIIIETHSEYIINRIRYRFAASEDNRIKELTKIFFVEKEEGQSKFREVEINEYGGISEWPEGFFDQSHDEIKNIFQASMEKRLREKRE